MTQLLPGMRCHSTEFFQDGAELYAIQGGSVRHFNEVPAATLEILDDAIAADDQLAAALIEMHPNSKAKRREQLVHCRFSGADFVADIRDGVLQDGEYWPCPLRGTCKYEGTICKLPVINGHRLEPIEVSLIQLSTTDLKNEVIAHDLKLPWGTFHKLKNQIHRKLGVQTKQQLTRIAYRFNLIWPEG